MSPLQAFPGHKDAVSGLAFREGTHELFSASFDRSIKLWSVDDKAYVDSLFGHQSEVSLTGTDAALQFACATHWCWGSRLYASRTGGVRVS